LNTPSCTKSQGQQGGKPLRPVPRTGSSVAIAANPPALIPRIHTSFSHHNPRRCSDSVEGKEQGRAKSLKRFTPLTPLGSPKCDIAEQHHPIRDMYRCDDNSPGSQTGKTNIDCYSKSKSATSALSPGPKASARQGPGVDRRRNRSRMNRIVADDMLP
jgi:hypothetical protein